MRGAQEAFNTSKGVANLEVKSNVTFGNNICLFELQHEQVKNYNMAHMWTVMRLRVARKNHIIVLNGVFKRKADIFVRAQI